MKTSFTSEEVAKAIRQAKWNDFYMNLKRADLAVFPVRTRGEAFSFAHALECDFQNRIGSRYSRQLAKVVFFKFIQDLKGERNVQMQDIEEDPDFFSKCFAKDHYLVFTIDTANDPTIFFVTTGLEDAYTRIRKLAVGTPLHARSEEPIAEVVDSFIVVNISTIISRLIKTLGE